MALSVLIKWMIPSALLAFGETRITASLGLNAVASVQVPKAYGAVILVNGIVSGFVLAALGFKVSAARKKYAMAGLNVVFSHSPLEVEQALP